MTPDGVDEENEGPRCEQHPEERTDQGIPDRSEKPSAADGAFRHSDDVNASDDSGAGRRGLTPNPTASTAPLRVD